MFHNGALSRYADLLSDLSLAILAAWVFDLVLVELPRKRTKERLYTDISWIVGLMANAGVEIKSFLATARERQRQR